jgi:hypothetical protein
MVRLPAVAGNFSFPRSVKIGAEAHPILHSLGGGDEAAGGVKLSTHRHLVP